MLTMEQATKAHQAQVRWYADKMTDGIPRRRPERKLFEDARTVPTQDDLFSATGRKKADDWRSRKVESLEGWATSAGETQGQTHHARQGAGLSGPAPTSRPWGSRSATPRL